MSRMKFDIQVYISEKKVKFKRGSRVWMTQKTLYGFLDLVFLGYNSSSETSPLLDVLSHQPGEKKHYN